MRPPQLQPSIQQGYTMPKERGTTPSGVSQTQPTTKGNGWKWGLGILVSLCVITGIMRMGAKMSSITQTGIAPSSTTSREVTAPSTTARPVLELRAWSWRKAYGYVEVEGQVKNISGASLENVAVVASFYEKDGGFITSDSALIEYNPILSGQVSPFKVMERWNPAMEKVQIEFKELLGKKLEHISVSK